MRLHLPRPFREDWSGSHHDPLVLLRRVVVGLLVSGTAAALLLWASGVAPRALTLAGLLWAGSAAAAWFIGTAGPAVDGIARVLQDVGLDRATGFSEIESLLARGQTALAAEQYAERANEPGARVEATCRRAVLLAGPLAVPALAAAELELLREGVLDPHADRRVGLPPGGHPRAGARRPGPRDGRIPAAPRCPSRRARGGTLAPRTRVAQGERRDRSRRGGRIASFGTTGSSATDRVRAPFMSVNILEGNDLAALATPGGTSLAVDWPAPRSPRAPGRPNLSSEHPRCSSGSSP